MNNPLMYICINKIGKPAEMIITKVNFPILKNISKLRKFSSVYSSEIFSSTSQIFLFLSRNYIILKKQIHFFAEKPVKLINYFGE